MDVVVVYGIRQNKERPSKKVKVVFRITSLLCLEQVTVIREKIGKSVVLNN